MGATSEPSTTPADRIGILGAGRAGTALARVAGLCGIDVVIAASRPPRLLKYHLLQYAPKALAVEAERIADGVSMVVLMVPQEDLDDIEPGSLAGTTVVDATNRWQDEDLPQWFEQGLASGLSSSEVIAGRFGQARVVKALNHISHWDMDSFGRHSTIPRRALAVASNHAQDAQRVACLVDTLGYDPVLLSSLSAGRALEPGSPVFNRQLSAAELRQHLAAAGQDQDFL